MRELLSLLNPQPGERILDVGCGAGQLMAAIADAGAVPTGFDLSEEIIEQAKQNYPGLDFRVEDARYYQTDSQFDAVVSHAALHWISDAEAAVRTISLALKEGGRFVAEFAGSGNVVTVTDAIEEALKKHGYAWEGLIPWYLPTAQQFASLLEQTGFRVTFIQHFEKPSPLKGGKNIRMWLDSFSNYFFQHVSPADKESIYQHIEASVKPRLYRDEQLILDTTRLRVTAIKESPSNVSNT
ncbi:class I SAM-dependent methyltransferase [Paenibacillus sp. GCM10027627]|uniref:class I SAM-dependent methyltransferase n=1 Tax=unclassified Paenibacillus TaxID=185978 RepID=UPI0036386609